MARVNIEQGGMCRYGCTIGGDAEDGLATVLQELTQIRATRYEMTLGRRSRRGDRCVQMII